MIKKSFLTSLVGKSVEKATDVIEAQNLGVITALKGSILALPAVSNTILLEEEYGVVKTATAVDITQIEED